MHSSMILNPPCIAIRPDVSGKPCHVKVQHPKIIEHIGDLASPRAGLLQTKLNKLSEHVDLIIHTAYEVNFLKSYNSVRSTNVASMPTLLAMAARRGVPMHFVSSNIVAMLQRSGELEMAEASPAQLRPPKDLNRENSNRIGYAAGN